ncbi:MAG: ATP-grasp domain-containing protein [Symploca sp. SIO1C2]|nr:ATP-grasp domain-containing protein [Symploca sp. SIO1C2]
MENTQVRIGIIHAYPSAYLIETLKATGCHIVLFVASPLTFDASDLEAVVEVPLHQPEKVIQTVVNYHREKPFDVLLPVYEGATALTAHAVERLGLPGVKVSGAAASRNKYLAYQKWFSKGIPVPLTIAIQDPTQGWKEIENHIGYPAIIKLADSMNSQGVIKVTSKDDYLKEVENLLKMLNRPINLDLQTDRNRLAYGTSPIKIIAQEYCPGTEVAVDCLVTPEKSQVLGIFEKAPATGPYFAEKMSISPTSLDTEAVQQVSQLAIDAVWALTEEKSSAAHVEIRFTDSGPKVLEAGLRPGGAYTVAAVEYLTGINPYVELLNILLGKRLRDFKSNSRAILYGGIVIPKSGVLHQIEGLEIFQKITDLLDVQILNQVEDKVYCLPQSAQPHFAYYLIGGSSRDDVLNKHRLIQESISLEISEFIPESQTVGNKS